MGASLLDTDILTEVFKGKNALVTANATAYLQDHQQFTISEFTYFEVMRGLRYKNATTKIGAFNKLCQGMLLVQVTHEVLDRAADIWALGHTNGKPHTDADVLIAATALVHDRQLVTGNTSHFQWIPGLKLANWKQRPTP